MFGFGKWRPVNRYNVRNPHCAEIFHPLATHALRAIGVIDEGRSSEDLFGEPNVSEGLENTFIAGFKAKLGGKRELHMAEVAHAHSSTIQDLSKGVFDKRQAEFSGISLGIDAIRIITFGTAPGLATNANHAMAITADMLYVIARHFCWEPSNTLAYRYGATILQFGAKFDAPNWHRYPKDRLKERVDGWSTGYVELREKIMVA